MGMKHKKAKASKPTPQEEDKKLAGIRGTSHHLEPASAAEVLVGAAAGAALGSMVGPPGTLTGAVIGGLAGAAAGVASERGRVLKGQHDAELDKEIGVTGGDLGEAKPNAPPAKIGAFSSGSMGAGGGGASGEAGTEGMIQSVDD